MKSNRTATLIIFVVLAVTLATISTFAFVYAATSTAAPSPSTTASGTNGYYPNGMMRDWSGMSSMMGGYSGSSSAVQTPTSAQNTFLPLVGFVALIGAAATGISGGAYYLTGFRTRIANHPQKVMVENSSERHCSLRFCFQNFNFRGAQSSRRSGFA